MLQLLPFLVSISIVITVLPLFFITNFSSFSPPAISETKPSIEHIKTNFSKVYKEDKPSMRNIENLKIIAIVSGSKKVALISQSGEIRNIMIGNKIGDYKVKDIMRNYITLARGEEIKKLSFQFESTEASQNLTKSNNKVFTKREIEKLTKDPAFLFQEIRLRPFIENGKTKGFAFEWIKPGSVFEKAGIKQGDILISINNMEIKSGEDAFKILQALRNEPNIRVSLLRDGEIIDINIRFD